MKPEQNLRPPGASAGGSAPTGPPGPSLDGVKSPTSDVELYPTPTRGLLKPDGGSPPAKPDPVKKSRIEGARSLVSTLALFLLAPLLALLIAGFVIQSYQVDGQSMETTLQNDDRLIVDKWPRTWARISGHDYIPHRGNIIIFNQSGIDLAGGGIKQLIKRVIGLPGERVVVKEGAITIYNKEHPEGFDPDKSGIYHIAATITPGDVDVTLKDNEIFVCGDNRPNSEDSRYFGPVSASQVVGKLAFRIIPVNKAQHF